MSTPAPVAVETFAPASTVGAGGALGALVGAANFVYTIVKDHGHQCTFATKDGGPGVSTVPKDMPVRIESRWEHGGVWYTHTRAWSSTVHSLYPHTTTDDPEKLTSSYLCIVFPFKVTYAVAVPDVLAINVEIAALEVDIRKTRLEVKQKVRKDLAEHLKERPEPPRRPHEPDDYRTPDERAREKRSRDREPTDEEARYERHLARYREARDRYNVKKADHDEVTDLIESLAEGQADLLKAKTALLDRKRDFRDQVEQNSDVKYMTNVHLSSADGWNDLPSKAWQNVKVNASMTLRADEVSPGTSPTVSIDLIWNETAIGYGNPWGGTITLRPGDATVTGKGKFLDRFSQLAILEEVT